LRWGLGIRRRRLGLRCPGFENAGGEFRSQLLADLLGDHPASVRRIDEVADGRTVYLHGGRTRRLRLVPLLPATRVAADDHAEDREGWDTGAGTDHQTDQRSKDDPAGAARFPRPHLCAKARSVFSHRSPFRSSS
jgi:hypothetical protein